MGAGNTVISGGTVSTTGGQDYSSGTVVLGANTTLTSSAATGEVFKFNAATVTGNNFDLTINNGSSTGVTIGSSFVNIENLTVNGLASLSGIVASNGRLAFSGAVTLTGDTELRAPEISLDAVSVSAGSPSLILNGGGMVTLGGAITGVGTLSTDAGGLTFANASVTTSGNQTYNDVIVLGGDVTFTSGAGTTLTLGPVVGAGNLTFQSSTILGGPVVVQN